MDQLDRRIGCAALDWVPWLSAHRPVGFYRQICTPRCNDDIPLPTGAMKDPQWMRRVSLRFVELRRDDDFDDQPMRRLVLLKQVIGNVSRTMGSERCRRQAESTDDKLGWAMRFVRAAEEIRMGTMRKCVDAYPHLATLADPDNPNCRIGAGLQKVREHAVELARASVVDDMRSLHMDNQQLDELQRTMRRENIQMRLKRMMPGVTTTIKAMSKADGTITVEPSEMAAVLRSHWGPTFAARSVDEDQLRTWLAEVFPDGGQGRAVAGLPEPASDAWRIESKDVKRAVASSSDTMPGPDGIPYVAWRSLGPLGIDVLLDAARALATPDGPRLMQEAHGGNAEDHELDLGILCW